MQLLYYSLALYLSLPFHNAGTAYAASSSKEEPEPDPCTIRSPNTGAFFDLNPLHIWDPASSGKKSGSGGGSSGGSGSSSGKHVREYSWNATGYGYPYNFTMNFCGGVVEDLEAKGGVAGVEKSAWRNVSAYYELGGKVWSLGMENHRPLFRGRKLVLNYTDGSPCGSDEPDKARHVVEDLTGRELIGDDDDDDDDKKKKEGDKDKEKDGKKPPASTNRKSTIISLLCDKDPLAAQLTLSFVGASPDECAYFFEARSPFACGGIETAKQTLSPSGVFGVIAIIAIMVYLVGGCVYSRMVLQQRGWRQVPNYAMWAGIVNFVKDLFIILFSSCLRFLPSRRGYSRVNGGLGGTGSGRSGRGRSDSEAENRLIDELNEEWED